MKYPTQTRFSYSFVDLATPAAIASNNKVNLKTEISLCVIQLTSLNGEIMKIWKLDYNPIYLRLSNSELFQNFV